MSSIAARPGRWTPWMGYVTWGLFAAAVAFSLSRTVGTPEDFQWGDFGAYYRAGRAVARGESPYRIDEYGPTSAFVYAPAYAYLFAPLSALDHTWAVRVWTLMNWGFCLACVLLVVHCS